MTKDEGYLTDAQLEAMGAAEMALQLSRHSGDPNFHLQVREAVLNRAAEILAARAVEPEGESVSCVYIPPDDSVPMWLTGCGHEHHKDPDLDLYDFCPYCGRPVEEGDAPAFEDSDRPADAGGLAPVHPALASRGEAAGDPVADVGPSSLNRKGDA